MGTVQRKMLLVTLVVATLGPLSVVGHGNLMWPPSWFDPNGTIGLSPGGFMQGGLPEDVYSWPNSPIMWFTNHTFIPGEATLDPSLITVPDFHGDAYTTWEKANCLNPGGLSQVDYNISETGIQLTQPRTPGWHPEAPQCSARVELLEGIPMVVECGQEQRLGNLERWIPAFGEAIALEWMLLI